MKWMRLPVNEIHLWCADPEDVRSDRAYAAALAIITAEERQRLERFVFLRDRLLYLATRALVRTVLSRYEAVAPAAWRFTISNHGRPEVSSQGERPLRFNLSNTNGLVVCAVVRDVEVGVDVEHVGRATAHLEVAEQFFAPAEVSALRALPRHEQHRRFCDYWTLKESYIKARGLGLTLPLDQFAFVLEPDRPPRIEIHPALRDDGESWQFVQQQPTADHLVAVCVRRRDRYDAHVIVRWQSLTMPYISPDEDGSPRLRDSVKEPAASTPCAGRLTRG
jgi:4'-phosphopantetheinyl transferase